jgi:cytochrome c5
MNFVNVLKMSGVVAVIGALGFVTLSAQAQDDHVEQAIVERIKPPVDLNTGTSAEVNRKPTAKEVAEGLCYNCHAYGGLGAPSTHNEWKKRYSARGLNGLLNTALRGKGDMPKKGGAVFLEDNEIKAVIKFMLHERKVI